MVGVELWPATPQGRGDVIIEGDPSERIGGIDRGRQRVQQLAQSLLATRIIARVEEHYKTRIPLRKLFESPTVAAMAAEIAAGAGKPALRRIKRIIRGNSANELILHASKNSR